MPTVDVLLIALLSPLWLQAAFAADAKPLIDNERVTVRELTWAKGETATMRRREYDSVRIYLTRGSIERRLADGAKKAITAKAGEAFFEHKGLTYTEAGMAEDPVRAIEIELKDHAVASLQNTSGYPNAFPRPRVKKVLENDRVIVWDYAWTPGVPTPMHFHDKDVVVVYMENGALKSTEPNGRSVVNDVSFGMTRFNARDRTHSEELVKGRSRAIITELK